MAQYYGLTSEGWQRYKKDTNPKNIEGRDRKIEA
jgi:hypothetical protein